MKTADIIPYQEFRTGLTFKDVFYMLWSWDSDSSTWKYKRRNTVLGKWHQIKKEMYDFYLNGLHQPPEETPNEELEALDTPHESGEDDNGQEATPIPQRSAQPKADDELPVPF